MLKLDTRGELDALHTGLIQESLTLDYKASSAVDKTPSKKEEIAKDASAFANAAGGQIVYGMTEQNNLPNGLDAGLDPSEFPGIWFEQVIQQNVTPQIDGLRVNEVPLGPGHTRIAVVVTIPAAQGRAPHQAKDGRYYRRHNFRNQIMNDSEVRDTLRRATTPELFVRLQLRNSQRAMVEFPEGNEISNPIGLHVLVGNRSLQPAFHTVLMVGLDRDLLIRTTNDFSQTGAPVSEAGSDKNWLHASYRLHLFSPFFRKPSLRP